MNCTTPLLLLLFFFILFVSRGSSQATGLGLLAGGADTSCLQKLLPCKDYVKSPSPPLSCCDPLKSIISTDTQCLCKTFNDHDSLKSLGITQDDALALAKTCGANVDVSVCNKTGSGSVSNSTVTGNTTTTTTTSPGPASSETKSGAFAIAYRGGALPTASIALWIAFSAIFCSQ
ncbi:hypothetical protein SAY87_000867 [Trapa incisa]|uniref:Bifunctional inhibitor/plant lipid transfer protein/seed storage helical domain-containing protein n=1 Tax=Trapa incisa TaxID=236973 RepID=A0AAN7JA36_9MYRT|nr:hypothetical protein SAY87_000867 [Trapa incisa]